MTEYYAKNVNAFGILVWNRPFIEIFLRFILIDVNLRINEWGATPFVRASFMVRYLGRFFRDRVNIQMKGYKHTNTTLNS